MPSTGGNHPRPVGPEDQLECREGARVCGISGILRLLRRWSLLSGQADGAVTRGVRIYDYGGGGEGE